MKSIKKLMKQTNQKSQWLMNERITDQVNQSIKETEGCWIKKHTINQWICQKSNWIYDESISNSLLLYAEINMTGSINYAKYQRQWVINESFNESIKN